MAIIQIEIDCEGKYCNDEGCEPCAHYMEIETLGICTLFQKSIYNEDTGRAIRPLRCLQCLVSEVKSNPLDEDYILPCDVKVYPATTITKGCKLGTLLKSIKLRESEG